MARHMRHATKGTIAQPRGQLLMRRVHPLRSPSDARLPAGGSLIRSGKWPHQPGDGVKGNNLRSRTDEAHNKTTAPQLSKQMSTHKKTARRQQGLDHSRSREPPRSGSTSSRKKTHRGQRYLALESTKKYDHQRCSGSPDRSGKSQGTDARRAEVQAMRRDAHLQKNVLPEKAFEVAQRAPMQTGDGAMESLGCQEHQCTQKSR